MTVDQRSTGWLDALFHARWREAMLHSLVYHDLMCPVYCLMPDHAHVVWMGCSSKSDQRLASALFRKAINRLLFPHRWQDQAFDHVLREEERLRGAFRSACHYVMNNPVRKGLTVDWKEYPFTGAVVPGFADLDPRREDFWEVFWKVYARKVGEEEPAC
jgi:hypothetical protein